MSRTANLRNLILKAKHAYYYSGVPVCKEAFWRLRSSMLDRWSA